MSVYLDAAYEVLTDHSEGLHCKEIYEEAVRRGLLNSLNGPTPGSMAGILYREVFKGSSRFEALGRGRYRAKAAVD